MIPPIRLLPGSISEILATASATRKLSKADRYGLMAALCEESLDEEDIRAINRILRSVNRGKIKIVENNSNPS